MDDLNACAECGFTTTDLHQFTQHVMEHEQGGATTPSSIPLNCPSSVESSGEIGGVASPGSRSVQSGGGEMDHSDGEGEEDGEVEMHNQVGY